MKCSRRPGRQPVAGDLVSTWDYNGQPFLYHWTARKFLPDIIRHGLVPGRTPNFQIDDPEYSQKIWFSTQDDRWSASVPGPAIMLRVLTCRIECRYDGVEWLNWPEGDDYNEDDVYADRLSDCTTRHPVPPEYLSVWVAGDQRWAWLPDLEE